MRVLIAPNSFKGSASAPTVAETIADGRPLQQAR